MIAPILFVAEAFNTPKAITRFSSGTRLRGAVEECMKGQSSPAIKGDRGEQTGVIDPDIREAPLPEAQATGVIEKGVTAPANISTAPLIKGTIPVSGRNRYPSMEQFLNGSAVKRSDRIPGVPAWSFQSQTINDNFSKAFIHDLRQGNS